jgi:hypothetical protein
MSTKINFLNNNNSHALKLSSLNSLSVDDSQNIGVYRRKCEIYFKLLEKNISSDVGYTWATDSNYSKKSVQSQFLNTAPCPYFWVYFSMTVGPVQMQLLHINKQKTFESRVAIISTLPCKKTRICNNPGFGTTLGVFCFTLCR